jgi:hypothetical protein
MIANNDYNRKTLRINTDADVTKWMKVGVDVNIGQSNTKRPIETAESLINKAITFVPVFSGLNVDGTFGYGQNGDNPYATATAGGTYNTVIPQLGVKGFIEITPLKGWVTTSSYSSNSVETREDYFRKPYDTYEGGVFKVVDDQQGIRDPVGMSGVRLEAEVHIVTASSAPLRNLLRAISRAGLGVESLVLQPLAASLAVLEDDERRLGVATVDIGGGTSDIVVFQGGVVRHTAIVGLGGRHLTQDIAIGLIFKTDDIGCHRKDIVFAQEPDRFTVFGCRSTLADVA